MCFIPGKFTNFSTSISLSKWPILHIIALFFIYFICSIVITCKFPVAVTKISVSYITDSSFLTGKPFIAA